MHRLARAAVLAASLVAAACRPSAPAPTVVVAPLDTAAPSYADSARVSFRMSQVGAHRGYDPARIRLYYDDGTGPRSISGSELTAVSHEGALLGQGHRRTATAGELSARLVILGERDATPPLVDTTFVLPLMPDRVWYVSMTVTRLDPQPPPSFCARVRLDVPIRDPAGGPPRDVLVVDASDASISGPNPVC